MQKFYIKFVSHVEGRTNKVRRHVSSTPASTHESHIVEVDKPDDLRNEIIRLGDEFYKKVGVQIGVTVGKLTDIPEGENRLYQDAISGAEWHWIKEWINEDVRE